VISDRAKVGEAQLSPCRAEDVAILLYSGEMILPDVSRYLGTLPKGSAACVVAWPWSRGDPLTLILGVPTRGKVAWYRGSIPW